MAREGRARRLSLLRQPDALAAPSLLNEASDTKSLLNAVVLSWLREGASGPASRFASYVWARRLL
jgi:hypothetical protein